MCLFYLYANAKIEIHICSNKHETGLVQIRLLRDKRIYSQVDHFMALWALSKSGVRWPSLRSSPGPIWCPPRFGLRAGPISHFSDLPENIRSSVCLFADDCVLYRNFESPTDCQILGQA